MQDYWLPTPLACFPFTSPTVRHRVPSGYERAITLYTVIPDEKSIFLEVLEPVTWGGEYVHMNMCLILMVTKIELFESV